jgi:hypothetical protein
MNARMNTNIEVINPHLWAVKFSWLPWISELKLNLDPAIPTDEQVLAISDEKVIVLNADNVHFPLYRDTLCILSGVTSKALNEELLEYERMKNRGAKTEAYLLMLQIESKRRKLAAKPAHYHTRKG